MQKEEFNEVFEKEVEVDEKTEAIVDKTEADEKTEEKTEHAETENKTEETQEAADSEDIGNSDDLNDVEVDDDEMTQGQTYIEIEDDEPERHHCGCNWGVAAHCAITAAICFVIFFIILACTNKKQTIHLIIDDNSMTNASVSGTEYYYVTEEKSAAAVQPEINMAKQFHLNDKSEENSAKLGIECTTVDQESVSQGLPKGVYVVSVPEGSAAHIGGMLTGDIITAVDGQAIENVEDLLGLMKTYEPGDKIRVSLVRYADGIVSKDVTVILSK